MCGELRSVGAGRGRAPAALEDTRRVNRPSPSAFDLPATHRNSGRIAIPRHWSHLHYGLTGYFIATSRRQRKSTLIPVPAPRTSPIKRYAQYRTPHLQERSLQRSAHVRILVRAEAVVGDRSCLLFAKRKCVSILSIMWPFDLTSYQLDIASSQALEQLRTHPSKDAYPPQ